MSRFAVATRLIASRNRGPFMPLLLALLLIVAIIVLLRTLANAERRPRSEHAYRPRGRSRPAGATHEAEAGTHWVATRAELEGLRDAYSSAPLDLARPLVRCGDCQAHYQADSLVALRREHSGRCALCGGDDLRPVHLA